MTETSQIVEITNAGKSPVILTGPHNGWAVPEEYFKNGYPLGLGAHWFDPSSQNRRHEACDWGMQDLFDAIEKKAPDICLVSAQISRLIVDLNRIETVMVYEASSETGEPIPGNTDLDESEMQQRLFRYYAPYHAALDKTLQETREKFGHALWIDMHSFTPTWQGEKRDVGVGTLKMERTPFTLKCEELLEDSFEHLFVADHPYDLSLSPYREINAGGVTAQRNGVEYFGIEIRNDLLEKPEQIKNMAACLLDVIEKLRSHCDQSE